MTPRAKKVVMVGGGLAALLALGGGAHAWHKRAKRAEGGVEPEAAKGGDAPTTAHSADEAPTPPADAPAAASVGEEYAELTRRLGPPDTWTREGQVLVQHGDRFYDRLDVLRHATGARESHWFEVTSFVPPIFRHASFAHRPVIVSGYRAPDATAPTGAIVVYERDRFLPARLDRFDVLHRLPEHPHHDRGEHREERRDREHERERDRDGGQR